MKLFLTTDSRDIIRKYYNKFIEKNYTIIDTIELKELFNIDFMDKNIDIYKKYILMQELEKQIKSVYYSKRFRSMIYIVDEIDPNFLEVFLKYLEDNQIYFTEMCLIDYSMRIDRELYDNFTKVF